MEDDRKGLEGLNTLHKEKGIGVEAGPGKAPEGQGTPAGGQDQQGIPGDAHGDRNDSKRETAGSRRKSWSSMTGSTRKKAPSRTTKRISSNTGASTKRSGKRSTRSLPPSMGNWSSKRKKFDALVPGLKPDVRRRYEMIKVRRNGVAVVSARSAICSGCNMNLPPQLFNELQRSDELIYCPNCNRIIYWE